MKNTTENLVAAVYLLQPPGLGNRESCFSFWQDPWREAALGGNTQPGCMAALSPAAVWGEQGTAQGDLPSHLCSSLLELQKTDGAKIPFLVGMRQMEVLPLAAAWLCAHLCG